MALAALARAAYSPAEASLLTKAQIFALAESIAAQLNFRPGDDLDALVKRLGGKVKVQDTLTEDPERSGSLFVEDESNFTIIVPSHTSLTRDRFTIAHELGHYFVHYLWRKRNGGGVAGPMMALRKGSDRIEWEANWFAAAFLMPAAEFKLRFQNLNSRLGAVASEFGVSESAANIRAKQLGLL